MTGMKPIGDPVDPGNLGDGEAFGCGAAFIPMAFAEGLGWVAIRVPQSAARAACLSVTAHIHLLNPRLPLRDLDAHAEDAIRALEDGARSVTVIDELHRVDRADTARSSGDAELPG
jgi:hypothetical protein